MLLQFDDLAIGKLVMIRGPQPILRPSGWAWDNDPYVSFHERQSLFERVKHLIGRPMTIVELCLPFAMIEAPPHMVFTPLGWQPSNAVRFSIDAREVEIQPVTVEYFNRYYGVKPEPACAADPPEVRPDALLPETEPEKKARRAKKANKGHK